MITIGNFFFKYRNILFIVLYLALFIPSPPLFNEARFGTTFFWWPIGIGLLITFKGQFIRALTIGLAYIVRGGKDGKVYAEGLVTEGVFAHCRNPLYVGNILMLAGVGVLANSFWYVVIVIPVFLFIYQAIVLAEEHFLQNKFGIGFIQYCQRVPRWWFRMNGFFKTISGMHYNWKRYVLKEHTTFFIWLTGIILIILFKYPHLTQHDPQWRLNILTWIIPILGLIYALIRYLKKSGRLVE
ncbi:MAG: isoprenylcysteine carboxylmethyltransferase family protein [Saprospiraceae bacterium]|nr:isoprenylcysteine carboxylmethyltransferase family protein [Saprospiraceae bacterium]